MKKIAIIITLLLTQWLAAAAQHQDDTDQQLKYAAYLVDNGKDALAFQTLNSLIKSRPSCHYAYYLRALNYYNARNTKSALYDIDQALRSRPLDTTYLALKGDILSMAGKYGKAAECYSTAAKAQRQDATPRLLYSAALAYLRDQNFTKATTFAEMLLQTAPECDSAKTLAAEIFTAAGNPTDALRVINTAAKHDAKYYRARGMAYCKAQMNQYAISDLNNAIDIDPSLHDIYIWRGIAKYQSGDRKGAHLDWEKAISLRQYSAKELLQKYK